MQTLLDSSKYKKFTQDRNKALEQINRNSQLDVSRITYDALDRVTGYVSSLSLLRDLNASVAHSVANELSNTIMTYFQVAARDIANRMVKTRKHTFILTYLAELEAIARATKKTRPLYSHEFKMKIDEQMKADTLTGKQLNLRVWQIFYRLHQKIVDAFLKGVILGKNGYEIVEDVRAVYPQMVGYKLPPRTIKPLRESNLGGGLPDEKEYDFYFGLTNDEDWDLAVKAYQDTELPPNRFDMEGARLDPEASYFKYDWELEQEQTDDFVQQVRDGQVKAATDMGIKEFVWIAILDNKTCEECCIPRNGKTTSEIEKMLASGELDATHCDARVPPAHPHCRCDIGPVASVDQVEGPDWKDFGTWLET